MLERVSAGMARAQAWSRKLLVCALTLAMCSATAASAQALALSDRPLEELLNTEIITADRLARQISDAPSAVSIVTAEDIRTYGYRTLSDILDSMRGVAMSHNRYYGFLSGRGYGNAGSFSGRITLLIDGYRAPDNYYGQTYFGADGLLDVELIERVEYIPGSGSSSYGDSAFLGVINVITKKGRAVGGVTLGADAGSHGWRRKRVAFGQQFDSGLDLLVSASGLSSDGRTMSTDDVSPGFEGKGYENDHNRRYFLKAGYAGWTFETASAKRWVPHENGRDVDDSTFARLRYDGELGPALKTSVDFYYGRYRWTFRDGRHRLSTGGDWRGVDAKLVGTWFDKHTIVTGVEYRDDFRQGFSEDDPDFDYSASDWTYRRTTSLYGYDDITLSDALRFSFGARLDARQGRRSRLNPRAALIWTPGTGTTLKLSAGQAHRQQTAASESWAPDPLVERVSTTELVLEQMFGPRTRLTASVYRYRIDNYIYNLQLGWVAGNFGAIDSRGFETELEHVWDNGIRLRASYAHQDAKREDGRVPSNLARHIGKLNLSAPLPGQLRIGAAVRYLGRRLNDADTYEPAHTVADLTLSGHWDNLFASVSVRNVGNADYREISEAQVTPEGAYPADGRNVWFQMEYRFK
ncbi:TonB-dependent receptor plug domain-containing protein [Denitromonas iodatirespirans]|uniref:TonB-dependent receptor n=1 Tax=Denitromonas iodatirespirans TaxID=2795389 RepID=A0A944DB66_DENI1|nr:TonB-dependent receptor [Denitromonas iodatirespirans]MBT0963299.1 TonB-dependent receptor [Denitromonas iodatirespirans]